MKKRTENKDGTSGKHYKVFGFKYTLMPKQSGNKGGGSLPEVHDFLLDQQVLQGPKEENKMLLDLIDLIVNITVRENTTVSSL